MYNRFFAILFLVCLAMADFGCSSESERKRRDEILFPAQTGSNIRRRAMISDADDKKKSKKKRASKPRATPERKMREPEAAEPATPPPPQETPTPPDRFR